jgi:N,N'-diacetyllegionaminate synthase
VVFVVAEIGVNWNGDFNLAKQMMTNAKKTGCNAVKFQAFNEEIIGKHPDRDKLLKSSISESNIKKIDEISRAVGIEWFCTPMFPEAVTFLEPYVQRFKIREIDARYLLNNKTTPLIDKIFETKKEIIVSSSVTPKNCKFNNFSNMKWLYCVPKYPCELSNLDFTSMKDFNGYSNHTPEIIVPITATVLGAQIIEVHVTLDKRKDFVDNAVSFNFSELEELVKEIRLIEKIKK